MDTQAEHASATFEEARRSDPDQPPHTYLLEQGADFRPAVEIADPVVDLADPVNADSNAEEARRPAVLELIEAATGIDGERPADLAATIESLLFVAEAPPSVRQLAEATNVPKDAVEEALEQIEQAAATRGIRLQRNGSTVRLVSAPESAPWIERMLGLERPNKLSKASLETLAIVVYRQPITRADVERVRGVSCDGPFHTLRSRDLIEPVGQVDGPGRPNLWAVTDRFLNHFSLRTLSELPPLPLLQDRPAQQGKLDKIRQPEAGDQEARPLAPPVEPAAFERRRLQPTPEPSAAAAGSGD